MIDVRINGHRLNIHFRDRRGDAQCDFHPCTATKIFRGIVRFEVTRYIPTFKLILQNFAVFGTFSPSQHPMQDEAPQVSDHKNEWSCLLEYSLEYSRISSTTGQNHRMDSQRCAANTFLNATSTTTQRPRMRLPQSQQDLVRNRLID